MFLIKYIYSTQILLLLCPMINSICHDKSDKCSKMKVYCNIYSYQELMMRECPKTCNSCISKITTIPDNVITLSKMMTIPTCYKSDSHKCKSLKNLCKNNAYEKIMKNECPFTCGICKLQKINKKKISKSLRRQNEDFEEIIDNFLNYYDFI
uniref:ShKT domain-containing protein n=1 Tax=Strongyloides papillosus TaxID=174720 RepID=A0A0N5BXB5_STREA